jgi:hypothetical protein
MDSKVEIMETVQNKNIMKREFFEKLIIRIISCDPNVLNMDYLYEKFEVEFQEVLKIFDEVKVDELVNYFIIRVKVDASQFTIADFSFKNLFEKIIRKNNSQSTDDVLYIHKIFLQDGTVNKALEILLDFEMKVIKIMGGNLNQEKLPMIYKYLFIHMKDKFIAYCKENQVVVAPRMKGKKIIFDNEQKGWKNIMDNYFCFHCNKIVYSTNGRPYACDHMGQSKKVINMELDYFNEIFHEK